MNKIKIQLRTREDGFGYIVSIFNQKTDRGLGFETLLLIDETDENKKLVEMISDAVQKVQE